MIIARLMEFDARAASRRAPSGFQEQAVRYVIELDVDGRMLGNEPIDTSDSTSKPNRNGTRRLAPYIKKSSGNSPRPFCDVPEYVFGRVTEESKAERAGRRRKAFLDLCTEATAASPHSATTAVIKFLTSFDPTTASWVEHLSADALVTFRVGDDFPIELPDIRRFWAAASEERALGSKRAKRSPGTTRSLPCIGCGQVAEPARIHPIKIVGIPGGQAAKDLVSADKPAYESYGLEKSLTAPTCVQCAWAYANALNRLLADPASRLRTENVVYVFWTADPEAAFNFVTLIDAPTAEMVRELFTAPFTAARGASLVVDETAFYALGLSAAGARVVVRSWLDTTVGAARLRVVRWFQLQEMVTRGGEPGGPVPLRRLAEATVRLNDRGYPLTRGDVPAKRTIDALIALALEGMPLPDGVLFDAVRRCRADQGVTRERAMLIRMALGSQAGTRKGREEPMPELDMSNDDPAYLCGRLLAKLDRLQWQALGQRNTTVVDKFYGSASTAPGSVFGLMLRNAQPHLATLRKGNAKSRAAWRAIENDIQSITSRLANYPPPLTLVQQGMFALGYYHQRAADAKAVREHGEVSANTSASAEAGAIGAALEA